MFDHRARILKTTDGAVVSIADDLAAAAFVVPPLKGGPFFAVPDAWNDSDRGVISHFDIFMWASAAIAMTNGRVVGARQQTLVVADDNVDTVDTANDELDIASHLYQTGDGPVQLTTTGTLPAGLATATDYWVIVVDTGAGGSIQLATSLANALAGTAIDITDAGSGTHTVVDTAETKRLQWGSLGLLGDAGDGAHSFDVNDGLFTRVKHNSTVVAYGIEATLDADGLSAEAHPIYVR